ncbi:LysR family transcriptional regulator [Streptomyces boncukensis]|uniref:LysR family transcriptional regulator n=1 Tax=Streptomyces boncukensis TaxID=2711219 RepID=A0A6G4X3H8_9ACTN|nr:LysR family transcriptional regulator [Streptomyces boncukensis]NGO72089.1 LysR family transcriptional regulator [Streptomyces boncukensis]
MDPHLLRTFVSVARHGSFSAAARELGYTQSAVSQHVAALESDIGAPLLGRRPVAPTRVDARLLEHAEPLLLRLDAARADLERLAAAPPARLVLGAAPLALTPRVAAALAAVRRTRPHGAVTVRVLGRAAVVRGVAAADLDLGLVDGAAAPTDPLRLPDVGPVTASGVGEEEPLALALPAGHPLARAHGAAGPRGVGPGLAGPRLADLADAYWIDAPDIAVPLPQLRAATGADGYRAAVRYDGTDAGGLLALVAAGHGLALLPRRVPAGAPDVATVPLAEPRLAHRVEAVRAGPAAREGLPRLFLDAVGA